MAQPGNDACTTAVTLSCGDTDIAGTTTAATDDDPATCGGAGDGTAGGVWYEIAGNGDEFTITLNADPGNADDLDDSQLAVYSGTCGALVCETGNDDNTPPGGAGSQVTFTSVNGTTYYAYADGWGANSGDFLISLACVVPPMPPGNDACSAATVLNCGDTDIAGTTTAATDDDPATCGGAGDGTAGGVWYEITGNGDEFTITLNADPGNADDLDDSQLAVYSGTCGALVCETGNDDNTPPGGAGSQVTFTSVNGTTYYAYADGFGGNSGDFLISLACTSCPAPTTLTAADITGTTVNLGWTESGTATTWDIEHGAAGFTQGTGTTVTGTTTNPFALTGLTACTDYEFYVRADCGGNSSDWSGPFAFSTIGATPNLTPACGA
ncbi:MAG: fibronectin type III domain-containing protein, partial [Saprospiraceae bacterium]